MARFFAQLRLGSTPAPASSTGSVFAAASAIPGQAKLTIGAPRDRYEREADQVASQVVDFLHAPAVREPPARGTVQRQEKEEDGETPEISSVEDDEAELVQNCDCCGGTCGTPEREKPEASEKPENIETRLQRARDGGGEAFPPTVRQPMEKAFGADFSGVTIHRDRPAHELNHTLQARAFTTGQDIFFRHGEYAPASRRGQELIAHELTHVVQQSGGKVQRAPSSPGPGHDKLLQRSCEDEECQEPEEVHVEIDPVEASDEDEGGEPPPKRAKKGAEEDLAEPVQAKPLAGRSAGQVLQRASAETGPRTGNPFFGAAAVPVSHGDLVVQRAKVLSGKELIPPEKAPPYLVAAGGVKGKAGDFDADYGPLETNGTATYMNAKWLHEQGEGSGVGATRPKYWKTYFVPLAPGPKPNAFCQGHFLNEHLSGEGKKKNLAPFTRSLNGLHRNQVERHVIDWVNDEGNWAHYKVEADYKGNKAVRKWALSKFDAMTPKQKSAAAKGLPGGGGVKDARDWLGDYVDQTFPSSIKCHVDYIKKNKKGQLRGTGWKAVELSNDFD